MSEEYLGADLARAALQANLSARYRKLDELEQFVSGNQYAGKPKFWDDDRPLLERAPCIVYTIVSSAIQSHAAMVLGEGRFPRFSTHGDEDAGPEDSDDPDDDDRFGLSAEDSEVIDPLIKAIVKQARLRPVAREVLERALGCGTGVAIACVINGRLTVEPTQAKWCTPTFDPNEPGRVVKLEIRYPYFEERREEGTGRIEQICMLYRRVLDEQSDTEYVPARANRSGAEPEWRVRRAYNHTFGFCPVIWYKFKAKHASVAELDGKAIHGRILDEVFALDLGRSQVHRATLSTLDPILTEIGVEDDERPGPMGAGPMLEYIGPRNLADARPEHFWGRPGNAPRAGRKRAPGMAYQYRNPQAKVELLTLPGDSMDAGHKNVAELKEMICEALHWRPIDPETMKTSALSGRAMEWVHRKQLDFDDEVRTDFGDGFLLPMVDLLLRIALVLRRRGAGVYLPGLDRALPVLERFEMQQERDGVDELGSVWICPQIDLIWGPYFPPTEADQKALGENVRADVDAKLITKRTALEKIATYYGITDVDAYLATLEKEEADHAHEVSEAEALLRGMQPRAVGGVPEAGDQVASRAVDQANL